MGFSEEDAFFLPDCYLKANAIGLGQRMPGQQIAECWRSTDAVSKIIRTAADVAGFKDVQVGAHDFRKAIHPFLARNGEMNVKQETAIQLNFGHTPSEVIKKNYTNMSDLHRQEYLDELCRAALGRSNTALVLAYERGIISIDDPDYSPAEELHKEATNKCNRLEVRKKLSDHLPHYGNDESKTVP